jgi:hypothetical protein
MMFGGGTRMKGPWGDVVTPNITLDPSGISHYDEVMFIKTIRTGRASGGVRQLNPLMPYSYFKNMTDDDLKAIFAYLRTVKPSGTTLIIRSHRFTASFADKSTVSGTRISGTS